MPPADTSAWKRTGRLLAGRRVQISPRYANRRTFAAERGVNWRTIHDAELGKRDNFRPETIRSFESAYMLVPGSLDRTVAGGDLEPESPDVPERRSVSRDTGDIPVISADPGQMSPFVDQVWAEVARAKAQHGPAPAGSQIFTDPHEVSQWGLDMLTEAERVRLISFIRMMTDRVHRDTNGNGNQQAS